MDGFARKLSRVLAVFLVITCNFVFLAITGEGTNTIAKAESIGSGVAVDENEEACVPGDINADGGVDNKDLISLFKYVLGESVYADSATVDTNGDEITDIKDTVRLLKYLADWDVRIYCKRFSKLNLSDPKRSESDTYYTKGGTKYTASNWSALTIDTPIAGQTYTYWKRKNTGLWDKENSQFTFVTVYVDNVAVESHGLQNTHSFTVPCDVNVTKLVFSVYNTEGSISTHGMVVLGTEQPPCFEPYGVFYYVYTDKSSHCNIRVYNIRSYGAKGDGQTDDTAAINACITACAGNSVYIPAGEYVVNGAITVPSDTVVFGDGDASVIKMHDNYNNGGFTNIAWRPETAPSNKVTTYSLITTAENSKNIVLRDFSLVGGEKLTNSDGIWGITVYKSENCLCENINIKNINYNAERIGEVYSFGLFVFKSNNVTVRGGVYKYCGYENIGMEYSENVTVENCRLGTAWRVPLQCHRGSHHIKIINNKIISTNCDKTHSLLTLHGQAITGFNDCVSDVLIENNYFKGMTSTATHPYCGGIQSVWQNEQDIRITGNTFECSNYCIVNASDRHEGTYVSGGWTITDNTIKGKYGISLWDDNIILEDNIIDTTGTAVAIQTKTENGYKSIVNNDYLNNYDVLDYVVR